MKNESRVCRLCNKRKPLSAFPKDRRYLQGHYYQCKLCFYHVYHKQNRERKPWYQTLCAVRQRCNYKRNCNYKYYGGKGITSDLTITDVRNLWLWYGADKMKKPSIDRFDSSKNYTFMNCRFIEQSENSKRRWKTDAKKK